MLFFSIYLVQVGPANETTLWLINEGREYIEAPRWADIGIVVVVLIFLANVYLTAMKGERTGIITVLMADLLALAGLYLAGMFYTNNISIDQSGGGGLFTYGLKLLGKYLLLL